MEAKRKKSLSFSSFPLFSSVDERCGDASVRHGCTGTSAHLFLANEAPVHAAGGVVPAPDRHSLQHLRFHNVATVFIDVVVGLAVLPKTTVIREKTERKVILIGNISNMLLLYFVHC